MAQANALGYGQLIESLERQMGMSIDTIARALEVDRRTVERWRANQTLPQGKTRRRLAELVELRDRMMKMFGSARRTRAWLHAPSRYLGQFTPEEAIRAGRLDRVRADLDGLAAGVFL